MFERLFIVSIPSRSGLLQNTRPEQSGRGDGFNPFSFRSPSKPIAMQHVHRVVSIPSRSGLLQNGVRAEVALRFAVSIPSRSGLLQNLRDQNVEEAVAVSIPSRSGLLQNNRCHTPKSYSVSIPSRSGLLQNAVGGRSNVVRRGFNPFSFRSPSKHRTVFGPVDGLVSIPSRSGLLQNAVCSASTPADAFQSLLVQVSFKTQRRDRADYQHDRFNPFSFRSPSKPPPAQNPVPAFVSIPSRSGLLQNALLRPSAQSDRSFNPFSFRSPSKHASCGPSDAG